MALTKNTDESISGLIMGLNKIVLMTTQITQIRKGRSKYLPSLIKFLLSFFKPNKRNIIPRADIILFLPSYGNK